MPMDKINLNEKAKKDFLNYAGAVIKSRAISFAEDNLKPVHRRILYAMSELGLQSNKKTKKSARIVGDIIGKYHPHGDTSAYGAMVRLGQPWKMRYPLVEIQGNAGNILGDGPAAMRYTEAKLTPFGEMMLEGINRGAVRFKPNYDETTVEPVVLPSLFPNILCNGNTGIAVGMSASLVPHNLKEVVAAIDAYLKFKNISIEQLMKLIPGPDFPTGGAIVDANKLREIYYTGSGTITLRSKYHIENVGNAQHIVITEIPYLVNIESGIIEPLKKLVIEDGYELIEDFENNTGKDGVNLRIKLKKGANVYRVLETLWSETRLQITQRVGNTVLVNGNPVVLNLKELIEQYVLHRHEIITNIAKYDLEKVNDRMLIVSALLKALADIDTVIALIKSSENKDNAREKLIELLSINVMQANAILDMKLSRLSKLDGIELKIELAELQKKEKELLEIISEESVREGIMRKELLQMSAKYGDERRTILSNTGGDVESGAPVEDVDVLLFADGSVYATQRDLSELPIRAKTNPLNASPITVHRRTRNDKELTVFTNDGALSKLRILTLSTEHLESGLFGAAPIAAFDFDDKSSLKEYIIFVTSGGLVKKTLTSEYLTAKNNSRTIRLKGNQELIFVGMANDDENLMILDEKLTYFKVKDIVATSKITIGSKGIASGKAISAALVSDKGKVLMLNSEGRGKLTKANEFVYAAKGSNGQVIADGTTHLSAEKEAYFIYDGSKNFYIKSNPATKGKMASGSKLINGNPFYLSR